MYDMSIRQETVDIKPQGTRFLLRRIGLAGKNKESKVGCLNRTLKFSLAVLLLTSYLTSLCPDFFILKTRMMLAITVLEGC